MAVWVELELCDGCKRCVKECPYDAIEFKDGKAYIGDRCTCCGACAKVCRRMAIQTDAQPKTIPDFSEYSGVWVFAEQRAGQLSRVSVELLGKAQELAQQLNQKVAAVLIGHNVADLSDTLINFGAETVYLSDGEIFNDYRSEPYSHVFTELVNEYKPSILLMGATHIGRDLAPRVSRAVGSGLTADCTELSIDPEEGILVQTRPAFGGNVMATIANRFSRPQMATVRPGVMEIISAPGKEGVVVAHESGVTEADVRTKILEFVKEESARIDLSKAKTIVAVGRGVHDSSGFELVQNLAIVLGAQIAGTRVAVEEGWVPSCNQVGQTGVTVRPDLYIACGVSGAIQHRAGMMGSRFILAINKDPYAPIFKVADWGIVGDLFDVVPELTKQLETACTVMCD